MKITYRKKDVFLGLLASLLFVTGCSTKEDITLNANTCIYAENADGSAKSPQSAIIEDTKIFTPYIGSFRSPKKLFDNSDTEYYFKISYDWFDKDKTIVKFKVELIIPSQKRTILNAEGFYGFDPSKKQIYVFGAFTRGMTGWGSLGEFNHRTGARTVWARSENDDGVVTYVRDGFEIIDENSWKNTTQICQSNDPEWKLANEDIYTRE